MKGWRKDIVRRKSKKAIFFFLGGRAGNKKGVRSYGDV